MPFSAHPFMRRATIYLPSNGKPLILKTLPSTPGWCFPGALETPPTNLFGNIVAKELQELKLREGILLQHGDLLIASLTKQSSDYNTAKTLRFLANRGYRVSPIKGSHITTTGPISGLHPISRHPCPGHGSQEDQRRLPILPTRKQLRGFLDTGEFSCIWFPSYGPDAKPLYEALKGEKREPLQ